MLKISLNYGYDSVTVDVPEKNYMGTLNPADTEEVDDPVAEVKRALENPISSKKLKELVSPEHRVVIVASDITRPVPSYIMLPPIIEELHEAGVSDDRIKVVFGLGVHRKQTEEEKRKLVGENVYSRIQCIDHDKDDCIKIGTTAKGTPVSVFSEVLKADFIIATGNLEFHYYAGFSGGAKAIMPGVCSKETIFANHRRFLDPDACAGQIEGNPVREELEEMSGIVGIDFMVNAVLNSHQKISKVVAGDITLAHREGAKYINDIFRVEIDELADIVITSPGGFPKDINLYQSHKAMENAVFAVKDGGIIIIVAACNEGLGDIHFAEALNEGLTPRDLIDELKHNFILGRHTASRIAHIHLNTGLYLISDLPEETKERLFVKSFDSVDAALAKALEVQGKKAKVLVIPFGVATLPNYTG